MASNKYDSDLLPLKYGVFATNFLLWALGVCLLGVVIWVRSDGAFWAYTDNMDIYRYYQACYICMAVAAVVLLVGFLGCIGAATENNLMLLAYFIICGILIILELAAAILVWRIPGGDMLQDRLGDEFQWHMEHRLNNEKSRQFLDLIQLKLECCGAETMSDYGKMSQDVPASCNNPRTNNINIRSCAEMLRRYLEKRGGAIGGLCCSLILVKMGTFFFTILLFMAKKNEQHPQYYKADQNGWQ